MKNTKITFKQNKEMGGRYESNITSLDGYQAKFIITKVFDKAKGYYTGWVLRVYDEGRDFPAYEYTTWIGEWARMKNIVEELNEAYEYHELFNPNPEEYDPQYATTHSKGYNPKEEA